MKVDLRMLEGDFLPASVVTGQGAHVLYWQTIGLDWKNERIFYCDCDETVE